MRYRSRERTRLYNPTEVTCLFYNGGTCFLPYKSPGFSYREVESMSDHLTPGYKSGRSGFLPQNNMSYSCTTTAEPVSQLIYYDGSGKRGRVCKGTVTQFMYNPIGGTSSGQGFTRLNIANPAAFNLNALIAEAQAKALARYSSPEYAFREPIAEIVNTIRTIKQPIHAIKRVVSRFSKRRDRYKDRLKGDRKALADLWLSYSVNAGPNMATVEDAIDAFARRAAQRYNIQVANAGSKYDSGPLYVSAAQTPSLGGMRHAQRVIRANVKATILYTVQDAADQSTILGLKARHLPGLIWELVPLSFMIDRLYNVKRFVDVAATMSSSKVRIAGACYTTRIDDVYSRWLTDLTVSGSPSPSPTSTPKMIERTFTYSRSKWSPSVFDVLPPLTLGKAAGSLHTILDAVSLTIGRLR